MKHSYLADLLKRYLHHDTTEGEGWTVDQWYEARDMPRPAAPTPAEQAATRARMWQRVQARTHPTWWQTPAVRWAVAALLVLAVGAAWLVPAQWRSATSARAGQTLLPAMRAAPGWVVRTNSTSRVVQVALADGSTVALAPNSRLRYPVKFEAPERVVTLEGEAFFEVFHDRQHPFRVLTNQLETLVLGTSFTVRAYPGQAEATVRVRTGRVQVHPRASTFLAGTTASVALVLLPNQQAVYSPQSPVLQRTLADQPALLQAQPLVFDERPVAEVLASLQAGYGVPIRYDGAALAACTVSLAFSTESFYEKLDLLCRVLNARYERTDDAIIFRSPGCLSE